jgi:hypothetical protein
MNRAFYTETNPGYGARDFQATWLLQEQKLSAGQKDRPLLAIRPLQNKRALAKQVSQF